MKTAVLLVLLIAAQEFAQQHAPTVDQCRADASVWNAAVMNHNPRILQLKATSYGAFLSEGRYAANVVDGKLTLCGRPAQR
jgi:hypothetical protein